MKSLNSLFTYGTLQLGQSHDHYLTKLKGIWRDAYLLGNYITKGSMAQIGYPIIKTNPHGEKIKGKLFESSQLMSIIKLLDAYEGHYYQRVVTTVYLSNGLTKKAFVYEAAK